MDLQIRAPDVNGMPANGFHQLKDGTCAHVVRDICVYQVRFFPPGYVRADNYEQIGRHSARMAASVFGTATPPPSPTLPPPQDKGKARAP